MKAVILHPVVVGLVGLSLMSCNHAKAEPRTSALMRVGANIPAVVGVDQHGVAHATQPPGPQPLVVYFYPKDGTPGCTKEACAFRDVWARFEQRGVRLLGVSRDDRPSHAKFAAEHQIPFPLIADVDGNWGKAFGVPSAGGRSARVSFLFDKSGHLAHVYPNVDPGVHANEVLKDAEELR